MEGGHGHQAQIVVHDLPLPEGWTKRASKSRPGHYAYKNTHTGEKIGWRPTLPASRKKGQLPPAPSPKKKTDAVREFSDDMAAEVEAMMRGGSQDDDAPLSPTDAIAPPPEQQEIAAAERSAFGKGAFADAKALNQWLLENGISTLHWGGGKGKKSVASLFRELQKGKSELRLDADGTPLRATQVFRAKVRASADPHRFLLETHEQSPDGGISARNRLLSGRLEDCSMELPGAVGAFTDEDYRLLDLEVRRKVLRKLNGRQRQQPPPNNPQPPNDNDEQQEEEQQQQQPDRERQPHPPAEPRDESPHHTRRTRKSVAARSPVRAFQSHTAETEVAAVRARDSLVITEETEDKRRSYPGLRTTYVLYTVIVECHGLPESDFQTFEYSFEQEPSAKKKKKAKKGGKRPLKKGKSKRGGKAPSPDADATAAAAPAPAEPVLRRVHYWCWRSAAQIEATLEAEVARTQRLAGGVRGRRRIGRRRSNSVVRMLSGSLLDGIDEGIPGQESFDEGGGGARAAGAAGATDDDSNAVEVTLIGQAFHLDPDEERVLRRLFPAHSGGDMGKNYAKIECQSLHGGFSGSKVLQVQGFCPEGKPQEPTVVKLDTRANVTEERHKMDKIGPYLGENTVRAISVACAGARAGLMIQLAGGGWQLPDLLHIRQPEPLLTFKELFCDRLRLAASIDSKADADVDDARLRAFSKIEMFRDDPTLHEARDFYDQQGGSAADASPTALAEAAAAVRQGQGRSRRHTRASVRSVLSDVFGEIMRRPSSEKPEERGRATRSPRTNLICDAYDIPRVMRTRAERATARKQTLSEDARIFFDDFCRHVEHYGDNGGEGGGGDAAAGKDLFAKRSKGKKGKSEAGQPCWFGLVHGDFNGMNILIDSEGIVWIIDFAKAGVAHSLKDVAKLEVCICIEYTELNSDAELNAAIAATRVLADVSDLRRPLKRLFERARAAAAESGDVSAGWLASFDVTLDAVRQLRRFAAVYCRDTSQFLQFNAAVLNYAARATAFRDITDLQKKWALALAKAHAAKLQEAIPFGGSSIKLPALSPREAPDPSGDAMGGGGGTALDLNRQLFKPVKILRNTFVD